MSSPDQPWPANHKGHWWTGWPGAHCMRCGASDPMEHAVANNYFDPYTGEWDTEDHKLEFERDSICSADPL